jgi:hypothetical protein
MREYLGVRGEGREEGGGVGVGVGGVVGGGGGGDVPAADLLAEGEVQRNMRALPPHLLRT